MNEPNQSKVIAEEIQSVFEESTDYIRESKLDLGISNMRSRIRDVNIQTEGNCDTTDKPKAKKRYKDKELAEVAIDVYRNNINPKEEKKKGEKLVKTPDTIASRAHMRAMANALAGMRNNGGSEGRLAPTAGPNGGSTGTPGCGNYYALTTSMTLEEYGEYIKNKFVTEEEEVEEVFEETPELLVEDPVGELEDQLLKMEDISWQSIDKVMRKIAAEYDITPKQLHKDFKAEHKMIPDEWAKKQQVDEEVGWFPLEEAVRMNKIGQVYEVSFLFRGGTQRLKFFWPEVGIPSRKDMEDACKKFWPGARLLAFYPSMSAGDNQDNFMVLVPAMTENFHIIDDTAWVQMTEQESMAYQMICEEEGEPVSSPMIQDDGSTLLLIENHDTGEVQEVVIEGNKSGDASLHDWFNKSKSSDGKKGWVQIGGPYAGKPCAKQEGQKSKPKCGSSKMKRNLNDKEEDKAFNRKNREDGDANRSGKAKNVKTEEVVMEGEGKKDACYNKVKSRYKVWPSAYASGALVKCRKKGADNWGNSTKKEEVTLNVDGAFTQEVDEACWKGYTKKGMKTMFGKKYPNCVKKEEYKSDKNYKAPKVPAKKKPYDKIASFSLERPSSRSMKEDYIDEELTGERLARADAKKQSLGRIKSTRDARVALDRVARGREGTGTDGGRKAPTKRGGGGNPGRTKVSGGGGDDADRGDGNKAAKRAAELKKEGYFFEGDEMKGMSQKSGDKRSTESGAGMTAKGVAKYNKRTGGNLKTAVTTPPSELKPGSKAAGRRKSFCARSKSWNGERGKAARRRWNC